MVIQWARRPGNVYTTFGLPARPSIAPLVKGDVDIKQILVIHLYDGDQIATVSLLGYDLQIRRMGCAGDLDRAQALIAEYDGRVDAIALEGMPTDLRLGASAP